MERPDRVVAEEPLEIRVAAPGHEPVPVGVTMRTPGNDFELAVGFLLSEGILADADGLAGVRYCPDPGGPQLYNVVTVDTRAPVDLEGRQRLSTISSSCGICGTSALDLVERRCPPLGAGATLDQRVLLSLPDELRRRQRLFEQTGGLHGAGLFDAGGTAVAVREDVGRHNAVDKLVGWAALAGGVPLDRLVMVVSGRVSFEIVQKAALAGVPVLLAVSAPSDLAVRTARRVGMTLMAFVRGDRANVYSCPERVGVEPPR